MRSRIDYIQKQLFIANTLVADTRSKRLFLVSDSEAGCVAAEDKDVPENQAQEQFFAEDL